MNKWQIQKLAVPQANGVSEICHTEEARIRYAMALGNRAIGSPSNGRVAPLYHVTTPEIAPLILREGFTDSAAAKTIFGVTTYQFESGVWLAEVPPITAISVDQFMGHSDEAWIEVLATDVFFEVHMRGNEWNDPSWPTRQWLIPAEAVNRLDRREIALVDVLRMRIADCSTKHNAYYTAAVIKRQIQNEMRGAVARRWFAALNEAVATTSP